MGRMWACAAAAAATASITAVAFADQATPAEGVTPNDARVELKPDLTATSFSAQNGYFFATMSKYAYQPEDNLAELLKGMEGCKGLEEHYQFFQSGPAGRGDSLLEIARERIQDTEGFIAANDDVLLLVFRGTSELIDWLTNFRGLPRVVPTTWNVEREGSSIHRGFDDAVNSVWEPIHEKIKELYGDGTGRSCTSRATLSEAPLPPSPLPGWCSRTT